MKKIFVYLILFFLICPIDGYSQTKPRKSAKRAKIETISKKRAKSKAAPKRKTAQKRRQKTRIKNNKPEKINGMWKSNLLPDNQIKLLPYIIEEQERNRNT
jgi:hypothetical protein